MLYLGEPLKNVQKLQLVQNVGSYNACYVSPPRAASFASLPLGPVQGANFDLESPS